MADKIKCEVVLLGPPASGKGTLATHLSNNLNYNVVTPGDIYRRLREEDTEIGRLVRDSLKDGGYCPSSLTNQIMLREATEVATIMGAFNTPNRLVFDGYPRDQEQYDFLLEHFEVGAFVHIDAPYERTLRAAINRRICKECKQIFSAECPPKATGAQVIEIDGHELVGFPKTNCLKDGGYGLPDQREHCASCTEQAWETRWDDTEEMYAKRYATFLQLTQPIIDQVRTQPNYRRFTVLDNSEAFSEVEDWLDTVLGVVC